jgi:hypothetical protein
VAYRAKIGHPAKTHHVARPLVGFFFLIYFSIFYKIHLVLASRTIGLNAAKEKLEIVSGAAPPPFQILTVNFSEKCVRTNSRIRHKIK